MKNFIKTVFIFYACCLSTSLWAVDTADQVNINFSGTLTFPPPCTVDTTQLDINFNDVNADDILTKGKSDPKTVAIVLNDCKTQYGSSFKIEFDGSKDSDDSTLLALDSTSTAKGVGIGFYMPDGTTQIPLNTASSNIAFTDGDNTFNFLSFLTLSDKDTLSAGQFAASATATITFN